MPHNHSLSTSSADFGDFNSAPASSAQTSALSQDDLLGSYDETIRYSPSLKSLPSPTAGASNLDLLLHDHNVEEHRRPGTSWPVQPPVVKLPTGTLIIQSPHILDHLALQESLQTTYPTFALPVASPHFLPLARLHRLLSQKLDATSYFTHPMIIRMITLPELCKKCKVMAKNLAIRCN